MSDRFPCSNWGPNPPCSALRTPVFHSDKPSPFMPRPPVHPALENASRSARRELNRCKPQRRALDALGYPRVKVNGRSKYAHRVAFEFFWRKLEPGERVYRTCGDRRCLNYFHLTTEKPQPTAKKRHRPGTAKLTPRRVRNIRKKWTLPEAERPTQAELARRYSVSRSCVSLIVRNITWRDI